MSWPASLTPEEANPRSGNFLLLKPSWLTRRPGEAGPAAGRRLERGHRPSGTSPRALPEVCPVVRSDPAYHTKYGGNRRIPRWRRILGVTLYGRVFIRGDIAAVTGLHIGGAAGALAIGASTRGHPRLADQPPYVPGSSLRGKCALCGQEIGA